VVGNFTGEPMWNVSGISGAASVWVEVMNRLHRHEVPAKREPRGWSRPGSILPTKPDPSRGMVYRVRNRSPEAKDVSWQQRILYPPRDGDRPGPGHPPRTAENVLCLANPQKGVHWALNDRSLPSTGKATAWTPRAGKYHLALKDEEGRPIDSVLFEVRGSNAEEHIEDVNNTAETQPKGITLSYPPPRGEG
jgi:penicillin-binding protein 1C